MERNFVHYPLNPTSILQLHVRWDWVGDPDQDSGRHSHKSPAFRKPAQNEGWWNREGDKHLDRCGQMLSTSACSRACGSGDLVKMHILIQWVWSKAWDPAVGTISPSTDHSLSSKALHGLHFCGVWRPFQKTLRPFPTMFPGYTNWVASTRSNFRNISNIFQK